MKDNIFSSTYAILVRRSRRSVNTSDVNVYKACTDRAVSSLLIIERHKDLSTSTKSLTHSQNPILGNYWTTAQPDIVEVSINLIRKFTGNCRLTTNNSSTTNRNLIDVLAAIKSAQKLLISRMLQRTLHQLPSIWRWVGKDKSAEKI